MNNLLTQRNGFFYLLKRPFWVILMISVFFFSNQAIAGKEMTESELPETLSPGLSYLLALADPGNTEVFDTNRVIELLSFVSGPKNNNTLYHADHTFDAPSAYYEFDIHTNLNEILQFSHNPEIPSFLLMPSSVRLSYWSEINGSRQAMPRLWQKLPTLSPATIVKGVEHIENTPDIFTGAYYQYDLYRALILFKYNGRNIFISISKQVDTSDVGRKGLVLGPDAAWNYLYSKEKGLSKAGFGWVNSYMYDSFAITVYDEVEPGKPFVKCGIFKWIRAGWANFNVVNHSHIYTGLERYAKTFKEIIEHPFLPEAVQIGKICSHIEALPDQELRNRVQKYIQLLKEQYAEDGLLSKKWIRDIFNKNQYVSTMSPEEMKSVLVVQSLKSILRKKIAVSDSNKPPLN